MQIKKYPNKKTLKQNKFIKKALCLLLLSFFITPIPVFAAFVCKNTDSLCSKYTKKSADCIGAIIDTCPFDNNRVICPEIDDYTCTKGKIYNPEKNNCAEAETLSSPYLITKTTKDSSSCTALILETFSEGSCSDGFTKADENTLLYAYNILGDSDKYDFLKSKNISTYEETAYSDGRLYQTDLDTKEFACMGAVTCPTSTKDAEITREEIQTATCKDQTFINKDLESNCYTTIDPSKSDDFYAIVSADLTKNSDMFVIDLEMINNITVTNLTFSQAEEYYTNITTPPGTGEAINSIINRDEYKNLEAMYPKIIDTIKENNAYVYIDPTSYGYYEDDSTEINFVNSPDEEQHNFVFISGTQINLSSEDLTSD